MSCCPRRDLETYKKKKNHLLVQGKKIKKKNQEVRQVALVTPAKLKISVWGLGKTTLKSLYQRTMANSYVLSSETAPRTVTNVGGTLLTPFFRLTLIKLYCRSDAYGFPPTMNSGVSFTSHSKNINVLFLLKVTIPNILCGVCQF